MKTTINFSQFCDKFKDMGRGEQFSYKGKKSLFEFLEAIEEETGEELELDVIALCCDFTEYENLNEVKESYDNIETLNDLRDNTQVIEIEGTDRLIIQNY